MTTPKLITEFFDSDKYEASIIKNNSIVAKYNASMSINTDQKDLTTVSIAYEPISGISDKSFQGLNSSTIFQTKSSDNQIQDTKIQNIYSDGKLFDAYVGDDVNKRNNVKFTKTEDGKIREEVYVDGVRKYSIEYFKVKEFKEPRNVWRTISVIMIPILVLLLVLLTIVLIQSRNGVAYSNRLKIGMGVFGFIMVLVAVLLGVFI